MLGVATFGVLSLGFFGFGASAQCSSADSSSSELLSLRLALLLEEVRVGGWRLIPASAVQSEYSLEELLENKHLPHGSDMACIYNLHVLFFFYLKTGKKKNVTAFFLYLELLLSLFHSSSASSSSLEIQKAPLSVISFS